MNEWIGFILSIAIFLYLMLKKRPPKDEPEQEDTLKDFLESLNEDMAAKKKPVTQPPRTPSPKPIKAKFTSPPPFIRPELGAQQSIVSSYFEKGVEYDVIGQAAPSRAHRLLRNLKDTRDMVILHEIIGPPKCRRR